MFLVLSVPVLRRYQLDVTIRLYQIIVCVILLRNVVNKLDLKTWRGINLQNTLPNIWRWEKMPSSFSSTWCYHQSVIFQPYLCRICEPLKGFLTRMSYEEHCNIHTGLFTCPFIPTKLLRYWSIWDWFLRHAQFSQCPMFFQVLDLTFAITVRRTSLITRTRGSTSCRFAHSYNPSTI